MLLAAEPPPMVFPADPSIRAIPRNWGANAFEPSALSPTRFPAITLPLLPWSKRPSKVLAETTFPSPAPEPPDGVRRRAPIRRMPPPALPSAADPVASTPT